ncbi:MAG: hypothetical protein QM539_10760 [Alphaproteobacteria bacterium]|nr:hypothetical protein [Alphaproteobacteria bacterium]
MKNKVFLNLIIGSILIQFQSCINDCAEGNDGGNLENKTNHIIKIVTIDKNVLQNVCKLDSFQTLFYSFSGGCIEPAVIQFNDRQPQFSQELFYNADTVKVIFDDTYFYYIYKVNDTAGIDSELGIDAYRNRFFFPSNGNRNRTFTELNYEYAKKQTLK